MMGVPATRSGFAGVPRAPRAAAGFGVEMGHHEEAQIAAQMLASIPHGTYAEVFHPSRDPLFWNLIANRAPIAQGEYTLPTGPGWGLELDEAFIAAHRDDR